MVTGADGLDEISLQGPTRVLLVEDGQIRELRWAPADFGFQPQSVDQLRVTGPADSAARIRRVLDGEPGHAREIVLANVAGALWIREAIELKRAVEQAAEAIDSGRAANLLERWRTL